MLGLWMLMDLDLDMTHHFLVVKLTNHGALVSLSKKQDLKKFFLKILYGSIAE